MALFGSRLAVRTVIRAYKSVIKGLESRNPSGRTSFVPSTGPNSLARKKPAAPVSGDWSCNQRCLKVPGSILCRAADDCSIWIKVAVIDAMSARPPPPRRASRLLKCLYGALCDTPTACATARIVTADSERGRHCQPDMQANSEASPHVAVDIGGNIQMWSKLDDDGKSSCPKAKRPVEPPPVLSAPFSANSIFVTVSGMSSTTTVEVEAPRASSPI